MCRNWEKALWKTKGGAAFSGLRELLSSRETQQLHLLRFVLATEIEEIVVLPANLSCEKTACYCSIVLHVHVHYKGLRELKRSHCRTWFKGRCCWWYTTMIEKSLISRSLKPSYCWLKMYNSRSQQCSQWKLYIYSGSECVLCSVLWNMDK